MIKLQDTTQTSEKKRLSRFTQKLYFRFQKYFFVNVEALKAQKTISIINITFIFNCNWIVIGIQEILVAIDSKDYKILEYEVVTKVYGIIDNNLTQIQYP